MSENTTVLPDQPIAQLTVRQLEALITTMVQHVVREELCRDYYVDEHGVKVLYKAEKVEAKSGLRLAVPLMRRWIQSQPTP